MMDGLLKGSVLYLRIYFKNNCCFGIETNKLNLIFFPTLFRFDVIVALESQGQPD